MKRRLALVCFLTACQALNPLLPHEDPLITQSRERFGEMEEKPTELVLPIEKLGVVELTPLPAVRREIVRCFDSLKRRGIIRSFVFLLEGQDRPRELAQVMKSARFEAKQQSVTVMLMTSLDELMIDRSPVRPVAAESLIGSYTGAAVDVETGDLYFYEESESIPWRRGRSTHLLPLEAIRGFCLAVENRAFEIVQDQERRKSIEIEMERRTVTIEGEQGAQTRKDVEIAPEEHRPAESRRRVDRRAEPRSTKSR